MATALRTRTPLSAMRKNCVDCAGGNRKYVKFCTCDGLHSTRCEFWPYRFGNRPATIKDQRLVTPERMPPADIPLGAAVRCRLETFAAGVGERAEIEKDRPDWLGRAVRPIVKPPTLWFIGDSASETVR